MTKAQYLNALRSCLAGRIAESELQNVLDYYDEYFEEAGIEQEAWTAKGLGEPETLAAQILAEQLPAEPAAAAQGAPAAGRSRRRTGWIALALLAVLAAGGLLLSLRGCRPAQGEPSDPTLSTQQVIVSVQAGAADGDGVPGADGAAVELPAEIPVTYSSGYHTFLNAEDVRRLDIDVSWADITIRRGAEWNLSMSWQRWSDALGYGYQDGTLYIRSRQETASGSVLPIETPMIDITVPVACTLEQLSISSALGNLTLHQVTASTTNLSASSGDIQLSQCELGDAVLSLALGNLTASDCAAQTFGALLAQGDISLLGCELSEAELSVSLGNVELQRCPLLDHYREISLSTVVGSILLNGQERKQNYLFEGHGRQTLTVACNLGDIVMQIGTE